MAPDETERGAAVLYLDVDGVLLRDVPEPGAGPEARLRPRVPAPGADGFLRWAVERFEVRWLTAWAPTGSLAEPDRRRLADLLDVEEALLARIEGAAWSESKLEAIDLDDPRPWWWVDDRPPPRDVRVLERLGIDGRWIECRSDLDARALIRVRRRLAQAVDGTL